ncbi:AMP-binding protein, partial [Frankia sp. CN7]
ARRWAELVGGHAVTVLNCVPTVLDLLLGAGGPLGSLRAVLLGGDRVGVDLPGRLEAAAPGCRFLALGGTTETAIHSTILEVPAGGPVPPEWRCVPYGTPLRNVRLRVVDPLGRDCPDHVPGELWIGGDGVALGYLADPELTASRFVELAGARWYRTGDLARYTPDGTVEFLGRGDDQVKIRGFRVELGEVEAALLAVPGVRAGVAAVTAAGPGRGPSLSAAVVLVAGPSPVEQPAVAAAAVREALRLALPPHMVPDRVVVLGELPLTKNGKIDRRAVGALLAGPVAGGEAARSAPRDDLERVLLKIWREVLAAADPGVSDEFFALGGDSVLATALVARVREELDTEDVSVRALFGAPTIAGFAEALRRVEPSPGRLDRVASLVLEIDALSDSEVEALLAATPGGEPGTEPLAADRGDRAATGDEGSAGQASADEATVGQAAVEPPATGQLATGRPAAGQPATGAAGPGERAAAVADPLADDWARWPEEFERRYRADGYWRDETLGELPRAWARRSGDATALVAGDRRISYAELDAEADDLAAGLATLGLAAGDRVILHLPNRAELVTVLFALARLGAVPVLALPAHRRTEIEHFARLSDAVAYVIADRHEGFDYRDLAGELTEAVGSLRHVLVAGEAGPFTALDAVAAAGAAARRRGEAAGPAGASPPGARAPDAGAPRQDPAGVALMLISGGTTGKPKLIPRTHRDYAYNARASAAVAGLAAADVYLAALPAAHNFPLACPGILGTLGAGGTVVLAASASPDVAFRLIAAERVTVTALVPALARMWTDAAGWERPDLTSLRLLQVGGARLDEGLAREIPGALGCAVQQVFGMAEGLLNFTRLDDPPDLVATTQGRPLADADELRVVDGEGAEVAPTEVGELWTRGPYTIRGYYRAAAHNAVTFTSDGFYRTGDLVRRLPSGHLVVEGRVKDVINRGGEKISAGELEEELLAHPAIAQAAVVGIADETVGESICAVVVPPPGAEPPGLGQLRGHLVERGLARIKLPDRLVVLDALPLTAVGKIDKKELRRRLDR